MSSTTDDGIQFYTLADLFEEEILFLFQIPQFEESEYTRDALNFALTYSFQKRDRIVFSPFDTVPNYVRVNIDLLKLHRFLRLARKLTFTDFVAGFLALNETFWPALVVNETLTGFVTFFRARNVTLCLLGMLELTYTFTMLVASQELKLQFQPLA